LTALKSDNSTIIIIRPVLNIKYSIFSDKKSLNTLYLSDNVEVYSRFNNAQNLLRPMSDKATNLSNFVAPKAPEARFQQPSNYLPKKPIRVMEKPQ